MKRGLRIFYGILPFFAAEAIQLVIAGGLSILYTIIVAVRVGFERGTEGLSDPSTIGTVFLEEMSIDILYFISFIAVIICGIVFFFWYRHEIKWDVRGKLSDILTKKNIGLFLLLGIGLQFFFSGAMSLIQPLFEEVFNKYAQTVEQLTSGNDLVVLLLMVLIAPVAEELIFRGVILHKLNKAIPFIGANILQALLFGIYHMNLVQGIYATLLGLVLGMVYNKFKSIYASIFLHAIINASSFLIMLVPESYISFILLTVLGIVLIVVTIYMLKPSEAVPFELKPEAMYSPRNTAESSNSIQMNYSINGQKDTLDYPENRYYSNDLDHTINSTDRNNPNEHLEEDERNK
jgi:membrane protease YdiL (CAAX protease family)